MNKLRTKRNKLKIDVSTWFMFQVFNAEERRFVEASILIIPEGEKKALEIGAGKGNRKHVSSPTLKKWMELEMQFIRCTKNPTNERMNNPLFLPFKHWAEEKMLNMSTKAYWWRSPTTIMANVVYLHINSKLIKCVIIVEADSVLTQSDVSWKKYVNVTRDAVTLAQKSW